MRRRTRLHASTRSSTVTGTPDEAWAVLASGAAGPQWYVDAAPLVLRGAVDRVLGGAGRRWPPPGRPLLADGDNVGFWRVTRATPYLLDLEADVRSPGRVRLTSRLAATGADTTLTQEVSFEPDGVLGQLYMLSDLTAREFVIELVHRRVLADLRHADEAS